MLFSTKVSAKIKEREFASPPNSGSVSCVETPDLMIKSRAELEILKLDKRRGTNPIDISEIVDSESPRHKTGVLIDNYAAKVKSR
jgi:hypothetical protein